MEWSLPLDSKLVFNLSLRTVRCINNDRISFANNEEGVCELAELIMALLQQTGTKETFVAISQTAIRSRLEERKTYYQNLGLVPEACEKLLAADKASLEEKAQMRLNLARADKNAVTIRLNYSAKLMACFNNEIVMREAESEPYRCKPGYFIRSLLEEYAQLPFAEREKYFFKETYDVLCGAAKCGQVLELSRQSRINRRDQNSRGSAIQFRPAELQVDPATGYNYIIGLFRNAKIAKENPAAEWKPDGLRLSRIVGLRHAASWTGSPEWLLPLTTEERKRLEKSKAERNISSFMFENEQISVRFTADGLKTLAQISADRPQLKDEKEIKKYSAYLKESLFISEKSSNDSAAALSSNREKRTSDKSKTWELVFLSPCSQTAKTQAKNYFRRFGKDAIIIDDLLSKKNGLKDFYLSAAEAYEKAAADVQMQKPQQANPI